MNQRIQLRKAQLYIANEIKRICELYGIHYFLDCGTLIGAVRHNGFIPWDDDLDIGMLREDYEKFLRLAPQALGKDFFIDNYSTNPEYALVFSKVRLVGTKYIEAKGNIKAAHNEVFVDIFPYFEISDNRFVRKIDGFRLGLLAQVIMSKSGYKVWMGDRFIKRLKFIPIRLLSVITSKVRLYDKVKKIYNKYHNTKCVCILDGSKQSYLHCFVPKEYLSEMIEGKFEGYRFPIPKEYDRYLTIVYGDYMTIPPKEQQITHMIRELNLGDYEF